MCTCAQRIDSRKTNWAANLDGGGVANTYDHTRNTDTGRNGNGARTDPRRKHLEILDLVTDA